MQKSKNIILSLGKINVYINFTEKQIAIYIFILYKKTTVLQNTTVFILKNVAFCNTFFILNFIKYSISFKFKRYLLEKWHYT